MSTEIQKIGKGEITLNDVQDKIITIQNKSVLLDSDVAWLYGVDTNDINQAVKRNPEKFPEGYVIGLTESEKKEVATICGNLLHKLKISKAGSESTFLCQSRSDGTLLTVSFNLRYRYRNRNGTLPQRLSRSCGTTQSCVRVRRLKSAVNKVPSLRDLFGQVA